MKQMTIEQFAMQTASNEPVPGGGSISALAGALAAALTDICCPMMEPASDTK